MLLLGTAVILTNKKILIEKRESYSLWFVAIIIGDDSGGV